MLSPLDSALDRSLSWFFPCFSTTLPSFFSCALATGSPAASRVGMPFSSKALKSAARVRGRSSCGGIAASCADLSSARRFPISFSRFARCCSSCACLRSSISRTSTAGSSSFQRDAPVLRSSRRTPRPGRASSRTRSHAAMTASLGSPPPPLAAPRMAVRTSCLKSRKASKYGLKVSSLLPPPSARGKPRSSPPSTTPKSRRICVMKLAMRRKRYAGGGRSEAR
mmetsp:Transcript_5739/g.16819  ORF Transcript_5739/g.16819 Transcript_5739/m.16819 type:complete len:224 (-) Transcript_5739:2-673(-)